MTTTDAPIAQRLHHTAYVTKDQAATRAFYEDILGFPLVATWSEADDLFGAVRVYCHTFFGLADGSALAFFQFAEDDDQKMFDPDLLPSPFRHIALKVDEAGQAEMKRRLEEANWKPEGTYVLEHGYCRSLYTEDPNGMLLEFTVDVAGRRTSSTPNGCRTLTKRSSAGSRATTPGTTHIAESPCRRQWPLNESRPAPRIPHPNVRPSRLLPNVSLRADVAGTRW